MGRVRAPPLAQTARNFAHHATTSSSAAAEAALATRAGQVPAAAAAAAAATAAVTTGASEALAHVDQIKTAAPADPPISPACSGGAGGVGPCAVDGGEAGDGLAVEALLPAREKRTRHLVSALASAMFLVCLHWL